MGANTIAERELVRISMEELCKEAGFADPENLVQRELLFLSESIESKTGVTISLSTIKRLLNGQFTRMPQIATLDALARFIGYQNWQGFKFSKNQKIGDRGTGVPEGGTRYSIRPGTLLWALVLVLVIVGLSAIMMTRKQGSINGQSAGFSAVKVTGNDLPNTVIFTYNIDTVHADSFFIQQSWDRGRRVRIDRNSHTLTDIYYEPGYHVAKLIANEQVIKTVDVSIPTDRWVFYSKERGPGALPKYIFPAEPFKNGSLQLTRKDLQSSKIDIQKKTQYLMVFFPGRIEGSSDNFNLKFRVRVDPLSDDLCPYLMSEVFCQRNFMYFMNTSKGCTSEMGAQFGENHLSGKTNDLSAMGTDVRVWQNIELVVRDKKISIRMNGAEVFSAVYHQSCGLITGLGFISNGLCEVDSVDMRSIDGKIIYSNNFDH